jgi:uncharacterized integral membrane protein
MPSVTPTSATSIPEPPELPPHPFIKSRKNLLLYVVASSILICLLILLIAMSMYHVVADNKGFALFDVTMSLLLAVVSGVCITGAILAHSEATFYKEDLVQQELEFYESQKTAFAEWRRQYRR